MDKCVLHVRSWSHSTDGFWCFQCVDQSEDNFRPAVFWSTEIQLNHDGETRKHLLEIIHRNAAEILCQSPLGFFFQWCNGPMAVDVLNWWIFMSGQISQCDVTCLNLHPCGQIVLRQPFFLHPVRSANIPQSINYHSGSHFTSRPLQFIYVFQNCDQRDTLWHHLLGVKMTGKSPGWLLEGRNDGLFIANHPSETSGAWWHRWLRAPARCGSQGSVVIQGPEPAVCSLLDVSPSSPKNRTCSLPNMGGLDV